MQPIAGFNYGARQYSRVKEVFKLAAMWATLVMTICFIVCAFFPYAAVGIFTSDPELKDFAAKGIRTMNIVMPVVGFGMISSNFFQCLGMVKKSIFLSLSRQLLFLVPMIYLLPNILQEKGVWISFPISDGMSFVCSLILIINLFNKFNKLNDGDDPSSLGSSI